MIYNTIFGTILHHNLLEVAIQLPDGRVGYVSPRQFSKRVIIEKGETVEVQILEESNAANQVVLSPVDRNWLSIVQAHEEGTTVLGTIMQRKEEEGYEVSVYNHTCFLPGSQIDLFVPDDYDQFIGKTFEFKVVNINHDIKNVVLSRRELLLQECQINPNLTFEDIHAGDVLNGIVKNIVEFGIFVTLSNELEGLLHITEYSWNFIPDINLFVKKGDKLQTKVISIDEERKKIFLSTKRLQADITGQGVGAQDVPTAAWEKIVEAYENGSTVEGRVLNISNQGFYVSVFDHICFLPGSQVDLVLPDDFNQYIGNTYNFKIIEINHEIQNAVVSRNIILSQEMKMNPNLRFEDIRQGDILRGVVKNVMPFGVFVSINNEIEGIVASKKYSWHYIPDLTQKVMKGEEIQVLVLDTNIEKRHLSLSVRHLKENPSEWISEGQIVDAEIIRVIDHGLLILLPHQLRGLVNSYTIHDYNKRLENHEFESKSIISIKVCSMNQEDNHIICQLNEPEPIPDQEQ